MKKTALPALLCLALLSTSLSHAMGLNPETQAFQFSAYIVANKGSIDYMRKLANGDITPLQEFVTMPAPEKTTPTVWISMNALFKQMLNMDKLEKTVNRTNPQTGNTALGDLITHCHPTNNFVHHMAEHLIEAGARLENIDSKGNHLCDLLAQARASGALTPNQYKDIAAKPKVKEHITQQKQEREARARSVSEMLEDFLPQDLHRPVTGYECGFPE